MRELLFGHLEQRHALARLFVGGSLPSAMLLTGPAGIGKRLIALELSSLVYCEAPSIEAGNAPAACGHCHSCNLFNSGNMPDLHLLECGEKDESSIATVRELLYSLNLRGFSSPYRVIIVNDADKLSVQSCNVLLKSVEEPRPNTFFMLVTSNASRLPITIRSRCQQWNFLPLSSEEMLQAVRNIPDLARLQSDTRSLNEVIQLADGSPGSAMQIASHVELSAEVSGVLDTVADGDLSRGIEKAAAWAKDKGSLRDVLQLARMHSRKRLRNAECDSEALRWSYAVRNFIMAEYMILDRNLNASYVLNAIFAQLFMEPQLDEEAIIAQNEPLIERVIV